MYVTDRNDMTIAVKVALNLNTNNQPCGTVFLRKITFVLFILNKFVKGCLLLKHSVYSIDCFG